MNFSELFSGKDVVVERGSISLIDHLSGTDPNYVVYDKTTGRSVATIEQLPHDPIWGTPSRQVIKFR